MPINPVHPELVLGFAKASTLGQAQHRPSSEQAKRSPNAVDRWAFICGMGHQAPACQLACATYTVAAPALFYGATALLVS